MESHTDPTIQCHFTLAMDHFKPPTSLAGRILLDPILLFEIVRAAELHYNPDCRQGSLQEL